MKGNSAPLNRISHCVNCTDLCVNKVVTWGDFLLNLQSKQNIEQIVVFIECLVEPKYVKCIF